MLGQQVMTGIPLRHGPELKGAEQQQQPELLAHIQLHADRLSDLGPGPTPLKSTAGLDNPQGPHQVTMPFHSGLQESTAPGSDVRARRWGSWEGAGRPSE